MKDNEERVGLPDATVGLQYFLFVPGAQGGLAESRNGPRALARKVAP